MMNSMRKMANGFLMKLLMLFLVVSFGIWGIGDIFRSSGSSGNYAAKVGDSTISINDFAHQRDQVMRRAEAAGFKNLNPGVMEVGVLRQMVQQRLIGLAFHDLGFYVNEALLSKALRAEPAFQTKDGKFSKIAFMNALQNERMSEGQLLNELKGEITQKFMLDSMDVADITPPAAVRKLSATTALETRDAWVVTIAPVAAPTLISKEALQDFYEKNKSVLYVKPESRTLEYVVLRPQQIESAIDQSVTSQMISDAQKADPKASTADIKSRLRGDQREKVMHNLEASLDDALAGGASLGDALSKANLSAPIKTLTDVREDPSKPETDDVLKTVIQQGFQMGEGETSGLLMSQNGTPLIVHVKSLQASSPQPYEAVANDVHDKVAEQQRADAARQRVIEVKQALTSLGDGKKEITDADVQAVLGKYHLNARAVSGLTRPQGKTESVQGIPASLQQAIFERQVGAVAGPLALASGSQMLAVVRETHHPDAATVETKSKSVSEKDSKELSEMLTQSVQSRGFGYLAEKHAVKINSSLLAKSAASASDE